MDDLLISKQTAITFLRPWIWAHSRHINPLPLSAHSNSTFSICYEPKRLSSLSSDSSITSPPNCLLPSLEASIAFRTWSRSSAVSPQVTEAKNPAVGCHYFPPGRGYLPSLQASPIGRYQIILLRASTTCPGLSWAARRPVMEPRPAHSFEVGLPLPLH